MLDEVDEVDVVVEVDVVDILGYGDLGATFLHDPFQGVASLSWKCGQGRQVNAPRQLLQVVRQTSKTVRCSMHATHTHTQSLITQSSLTNYSSNEVIVSQNLQWN